jgi:cation transport ATPase
MVSSAFNHLHFPSMQPGKNEPMPAKATINKLFLIDGIGAIITALLLSQVLARYESVFGMPASLLYILAGVAACFAVYSLTCYWRIKEGGAPFLTGIAVANTLYCIATLGIVAYRFDTLTWLGVAYFIGEVLVVMALVSVELGAARKA